MAICQAKRVRQNLRPGPTNNLVQLYKQKEEWPQFRTFLNQKTKTKQNKPTVVEAAA